MRASMQGSQCIKQVWINFLYSYYSVSFLYQVVMFGPRAKLDSFWNWDISGPRA